MQAWTTDLSSGLLRYGVLVLPSVCFSVQITMAAGHSCPVACLATPAITTLASGPPFKIDKIIGGFTIGRNSSRGVIAVIDCDSCDLLAGYQILYIYLSCHGSDWILDSETEVAEVAFKCQALEQFPLQTVVGYSQGAMEWACMRGTQRHAVWCMPISVPTPSGAI